MIGIIGGGDILNRITDHVEPVEIPTAYGSVAAARAIYAGTELVAVQRHGAGHVTLAHEVNYRAIVSAVASCAPDLVLGLSVCGALRPDISVGSIVLWDQLIDFTRKRIDTFLGGDTIGHPNMSFPVCKTKHRFFSQLPIDLDIPLVKEGVLACIDGPRFSTLAEILMYRQLGADVINMSAAPEAFLAREAGLCYFAVSLVSDADPKDEGNVTMTGIASEIKRYESRMNDLVRGYIRVATKATWDICGCSATHHEADIGQLGSTFDGD